MSMPQSGRAGRTTLALLGSLCLFLSAIEYLIPKPLPFMRIGMANLPLLLALNIFGPKDFFLLALIKVLGQGIIGGTLFSWVFLCSVAGTFSSATLMYLLRNFLGQKYLGFTGLSCAGAIASNGIQLVLARYMVFGPALRYLAPPFFASGFITGIALGLICEYFCRRSLWYAKHTRYAEADGSPQTEPLTEAETAAPIPADAVPQKKTFWDTTFSSGGLFCAGLCMALIFLFSQSLTSRVLQFCFFFLLALWAGRKINPLLTMVFMGGIVFFNLLVPCGKVLAAIGPLSITEGSLFSGLEKAIILQGLLLLSHACIKSDLRLPGTVGSLLGDSFRILELLRLKKGIIRRGSVVDGIDRLMVDTETAVAGTPENTPYQGPRLNGKTVVLLGGMVILTVVLGFLPIILL
jgi:heptaprenyl diphosphate synthase